MPPVTDPAGDDPAGHNAAGHNAAGDDAAGDHAAGDDSAGDAAGHDATGDNPPGGAGGGSPGHNGVTNARLHLHKNALAIKAMALTSKPVGAPTFLQGEFILTFNGGTSNLPPML